MKPFTILIFSIGFCAANAQYNSTLRSDRPGKTIGAYTVGKGLVQFQQGVGYRWGSEKREFIGPDSNPSGSLFKGTNSIEITTWENVVRFGILEKLEISATVNYNWLNHYWPEYSGPDPAIPRGNIKSNDFKDIDLGVRYNILDGTNPAKLAWGVQARAALYQWLFKESYNTPDLCLITALGRNFSKTHAMRINLGLNVSDLNANNLSYGVNYIFRPGPKFGITLEYFGDTYLGSIRNWYRHNYEVSLLYLLTDEIQLDIRSGYQQNESLWVQSNYFAGAGISYRFRA